MLCKTVVAYVEPLSGQCRVSKPDVSAWKPESLISGYWWVGHSEDETDVNLRQVRVKFGDHYSIMCYENAKAIKPFEKLCALSKPCAPPAKKPSV